VNARQQLRIVADNSRTSWVSPWGFRMEVDYDDQPGEPSIYWPTERAHPGSPANAVLLSCKVGGVEIYEMLDSGQIERIEEKILEELE
jgi:hypothetical protein